MATAPDPETRRRLESIFPLLARTRYSIRNGASNRYNCIAWVMQDVTRWWWPDTRSYWPIEIRVVTVECFTNAFQSLGFEPCHTDAVESGYAKFALYLANGRPTHAARIETPGVCTSKFGRAELIEHESNSLNGLSYGLPSLYFRKAL